LVNTKVKTGGLAGAVAAIIAIICTLFHG